MMNIEIKHVKRKGKLVPIRIVYNGTDYTVYDMIRSKSKSRKFFTMKDVEKEYKFVDEDSVRG